MSRYLSKFLLIFLIACLPLQGIAMQLRMIAQEGHAEQVMASHETAGAPHDCCPHDMPQPDDSSSPSSQPGNCHHCPLCAVSPAPAPLQPVSQVAGAILHPAPESALSDFYPDLPQRPPLA